MTEVRVIASVVEVRIPSNKGGSQIYRGVIYKDGSTEFLRSELDDEWDPLTEIDVGWAPAEDVPEQVKVALEYLASWQALENPDEVASLIAGMDRN
jgi:hypothetical protein